MRMMKLLVLGSLFGALAGAPAAEAIAADAAKPSVLVFNRVRFLAAPKAEQALVGGVFSGSNVSPTKGFEVLAEIKTPPVAGQWGELSFPNQKSYRWIRYEGPRGSYGQVSKIEFYAGDEKLTGQLFAPPFQMNQWASVVNDMPNQGISGKAADGQYVGIDLGDKASCPRPTISPGGGEFSKSATVTMACKTPSAVIRYTTDGTPPTSDNGQVYSAPLTVDANTTYRAAAFCDGLAPSPDADAVLLFEPIVRRTTLHFGNSLTGNAVGKFSLHARTAGVVHDTKPFLMGGGIARTLWNTAMIGVGDPKDKARWKDLFTTAKSMGGAGTYPLSVVEGSEKSWKNLWPMLTNVSDVTFQPRDADVPEEADYTLRWLKLVREKFPDVQPWLYIEWTEINRQRATDKGQVPSSQMKTLYPALTWEESMSAMMLYGEEVQRSMRQTYSEGKPVRIIPVALAIGWIHQQIEQGRFPGVAADAFYPFLFSDGVHLNSEGSFLVEAIWYAAFYGQSPEGKLLPIKLQLTPQQTQAIQRLAWDVVKNYPDCGLYEEGSQPVGKPQFSLAAAEIKEVTRVELESSTPGAWFRYTLDGTEPTRTRGYIYCGAISVRPGMTIKAVAYRSGMADSGVSAATYPERKETASTQRTDATAAAEPARVPCPAMVTALEPFVREHRIAGAVAVVATKDQVLCLEPIGYADVDAQTPMRTDNMFWIASMTKPITTTAMMMLVDEGKLNIEDPAEKYLPEFKELRIADSVDNSSLRAPRHPVTVKELLTHTSGMTESKKNHNLSLQDDVATFVADPMENQPGTRYRYSNVGITVGGRIIEVLTGMSYGDFMQRRLFDKLGMTDTTFFPNEQQVERVARTFRAKADKTGIENLTFDVKFPTGNVPPKLLLHYGAPTVAQYKNHYAHPSGGLFSTAADLLKFCRMLLGGGVAGGKQYVSQAAIKQMTSIQTGDLTVNPQEGYGLGWLVQKKVDQGHPSIGSFGHRGARKTLMWIDPSRQIVMILLLQSYDMSNKDADALYTAFVNTAEAMASAP